MDPDNLPRAIQRLAAAVGGISELAHRCRVDESRVWLWMSGSETPTYDESYVLSLIARREGVSLARVTTAPPPTISELRAKPGDGEGDGETSVATYEEYLSRLRRG